MEQPPLEPSFVGIDVSKDRLDAHLLPAGEAFAVAREGEGLQCLVATLQGRAPGLIYPTLPVTSVWAYAMFGEPVAAEALVGLLICLVGVWLARRHPTPGTVPAEFPSAARRGCAQTIR